VVNGPPVTDSPNLRLIDELGGVVHQAPSGDRAARERLVQEVVDQATAAGGQVRVIPVGGSDPVGAWGQVLAALEVVDQTRGRGLALDAILVPTATGGTQAGLIAGAALAARLAGAGPIEIHGVAVHDDPELESKVARLFAALAQMAGVEDIDGPVRLDRGQIGRGYGVPTAASEEAAALLARTEGVLVDPVYTAKGLAGLVERVRAGAFDGRTVVFWHGGGLPALFERLDA
jgi:1-aminocyclopropane-1-carboxylate deaminase/D-cysteine desulfhydrase-like pyridoxal-dependent ACC family enzyme